MTNEQVYYSFKLSFHLQNIRDSKLLVFKFHDWVRESCSNVGDGQLYN